MQFNPGDGNFQLQDDVGNSFLLDSKATRFILENADGTTFDMHKKDIDGYAPGNFTMRCGGDALIESEGKMKINGKSGTVVAGPTISYRRG